MKNRWNFVIWAAAVCVMLTAGLFVTGSAQGKGHGNGNGKGHGPKNSDARPRSQGTDVDDDRGPNANKKTKPRDDDDDSQVVGVQVPTNHGHQNGGPPVNTLPGNGLPNVGVPGNGQNNGVRDHGHGIGRGNGQGKGQGWWRRELKGQNSQVKNGKQYTPVVNPNVSLPPNPPVSSPRSRPHPKVVPGSSKMPDPNHVPPASSPRSTPHPKPGNSTIPDPNNVPPTTPAGDPLPPKTKRPRKAPITT